MLNKAWLYNESMKKPEVMPAPKVLWCLIDYSVKMEKLLSELCVLFQPGRQREEAGPSERRLEPALVPVLEPEPASQQAPASTAPSSTTPPPAPTSQPEAPGTGPEATATPGVADPTLQEPIPDSLNTDDIVSFNQWAAEGLREMGTPTTGSQGTTVSVTQTTPRSVTWSQQRGTGSVQTNLFGEPRVGMAETIRRRVWETFLGTFEGGV